MENEKTMVDEKTPNQDACEYAATAGKNADGNKQPVQRLVSERTFNSIMNEIEEIKKHVFVIERVLRTGEASSPELGRLSLESPAAALAATTSLYSSAMMTYSKARTLANKTGAYRKYYEAVKYGKFKRAHEKEKPTQKEVEAYVAFDNKDILSQDLDCEGLLETASALTAVLEADMKTLNSILYARNQEMKGNV